MRRRWAAPLIVAVVLAGCGGDDAPVSDPAVEAADFEFKAPEVTVSPGTTVTWTNSGSTDHTVKGPSFFSRAIDPGAKFSHRFEKAGSYDYLCTLHPDSMKGTVVVAD